MIPRVTTISRLRQHPSIDHFKIVNVCGSFAQVCIDYTSFRISVGETVLYIPPDVAIPQSVARALEIDRLCYPMWFSRTERNWRRRWKLQSNNLVFSEFGTTSAVSTPETTDILSLRRKDTNSALYCRVVVSDVGNSISQGVVLPVRFAVEKLCGRFNLPSALSGRDVFKVIPALSFLPIRPEPQPLIDLLQNPNLLRTLLDMRVWMSKRLVGRSVSLQYDASKDKVQFWDENAVSVPHGWWTRRTEIQKAHKLEVSSRRAQLLQPFVEAVRLLAIARFGGSVDVFLRGLICRSGHVYFYEIALHGADSFVMETKQFLRECRSLDLPIVPTLYTNRTLRSIVVETLGENLPTLPLIVNSSRHETLKDNSSRGVCTLKKDQSTSPRHRYNACNVRNSNHTVRIDYSHPTDLDFSDQSVVASQTQSEESSASLSWRRSRPIPSYIDDRPYNSNSNLANGSRIARNNRAVRQHFPRQTRGLSVGHRKSSGSNVATSGRSGCCHVNNAANRSARNRLAFTKDNTAQSYDSGRFRYERREVTMNPGTAKPSASEEQCDTCINTDNDIDWCGALTGLANTFATKASCANVDDNIDDDPMNTEWKNEEECFGFVIQVYNAKDMNRLVREFPHVCYRVGAQMLCEREMLRRGGTIDI